MGWWRGCLSTCTPQCVCIWTAAQEGVARHRDERFLAVFMVGVLGGSMSLCVLCSCWHQWAWIALHIPFPKHPSVSLFVLQKLDK